MQAIIRKVINQLQPMDHFDEIDLLSEPTSDQIFKNKSYVVEPFEQDLFWLLKDTVGQGFGLPIVPQPNFEVTEAPTLRTDICQGSEPEQSVESPLIVEERPQNPQTQATYKRQTKLLPNAVEPILRTCYKAVSKRKAANKQEAEQIETAGKLFKGTQRNISKLKLILGHKWFNEKVRENQYYLFEVAFQKKLNASNTTPAIRDSLRKFKSKILELIDDPANFTCFIERKKGGRQNKFVKNDISSPVDHRDNR